jgi:uncharacterized protein with von Willebrand factor type A (vWA) domain
MDQKFWPEVLGRIAGLQWASGTGMWALASILPRNAKQREKALFRNEIAHAKLKLARREKALARATIAARTAKLDSRESKVERMKASLQRTQDQTSKRDAERAEKKRLADLKASELRAQKQLMNQGASFHGTRAAFDDLSSHLRGGRR